MRGLPKRPPKRERCTQRVPAVVLEADNGAGRDQLAHCVRIAVMRSDVQCGPPAATARLGAPVRKHSAESIAEAGAAPSRRGGRGSPAVGLHVEVCVQRDEERDRLGVAVGNRGHQRR